MSDNKPFGESPADMLTSPSLLASAKAQADAYVRVTTNSLDTERYMLREPVANALFNHAKHASVQTIACAMINADPDWVNYKRDLAITAFDIADELESVVKMTPLERAQARKELEANTAAQALEAAKANAASIITRTLTQGDNRG